MDAKNGFADEDNPGWEVPKKLNIEGEEGLPGIKVGSPPWTFPEKLGIEGEEGFPVTKVWGIPDPKVFPETERF